MGLLQTLTFTTTYLVTLSLQVTPALAGDLPANVPPLRHGESVEGSAPPVDRGDRERLMLRDKYVETLRQIELLRTKNAFLEEQLADQRQQLESIARKPQDSRSSPQDILPLLRRMATVIGQFVSLDLPFQLPQRQTRINRLQQDLDDPDISIVEAFRRVDQVYREELGYSYTLEAYPDTLELGQTTRDVEFLRVGRLGLYYLAPDQDSAGYWDTGSHSWQPLARDFIPTLTQGIRIAKNQVPAKLLTLPVPAPVFSQ